MDTLLTLFMMAINACVLYSAFAIVVRNSGPRRSIQYNAWRAGLYIATGPAIFWFIPAALSLTDNELAQKLIVPGIVVAAIGMIVTGILYRYRGISGYYLR